MSGGRFGSDSSQLAIENGDGSVTYADGSPVVSTGSLDASRGGNLGSADGLLGRYRQNRKGAKSSPIIDEHTKQRDLSTAWFYGARWLRWLDRSNKPVTKPVEEDRLFSDAGSHIPQDPNYPAFLVEPLDWLRRNFSPWHQYYARVTTRYFSTEALGYDTTKQRKLDSKAQYAKRYHSLADIFSRDAETGVFGTFVKPRAWLHYIRSSNGLSFEFGDADRAEPRAFWKVAGRAGRAVWLVAYKGNPLTRLIWGVARAAAHTVKTTIRDSSLLAWWMLRAVIKLGVAPPLAVCGKALGVLGERPRLIPLVADLCLRPWRGINLENPLEYLGTPVGILGTALLLGIGVFAASSALGAITIPIPGVNIAIGGTLGTVLGISVATAYVAIAAAAAIISIPVLTPLAQDAAKHIVRPVTDTLHHCVKGCWMRLKYGLLNLVTASSKAELAFDGEDTALLERGHLSNENKLGIHAMIAAHNSGKLTHEGETRALHPSNVVILQTLLRANAEQCGLHVGNASQLVTALHDQPQQPLSQSPTEIDTVGLVDNKIRQSLSVTFEDSKVSLFRAKDMDSPAASVAVAEECMTKVLRPLLKTSY